MPLSSRTHQVADAEAAQELFDRNGWGDGLPIVPPTPDRVAALVAASGHEARQVIGQIPEQGRELTIEKVAVNAVAAGCRPEHMTAVVAAVRAMASNAFNLHSTTVSGATAPLVIVSGEAVTTLGINTSFSVFGSGHAANATIGRAVRLVSQNLCGGTPGLLDKATLGHPGKYSYCIGESLERSPWAPLHADRGRPVEASAVTVFAGEAPIYARNDWAAEPEPILATIADAMGVGHFTGGAFVVVLGPLHACLIAEAGWTKDDVRRHLHRHARRSVADLKRAGRLPGAVEAGDSGTWRAAVSRSDDILIVVAGGHLYGYSAVIPPWVGGHESQPVTELIESVPGTACPKEGPLWTVA